MDTARPFVAHISISRERTMIVVRRELAAVNPAAFVIERRLNEGRTELAFVESGMRAFVKAVESDVPSLHNFLGSADVEIMGALRTDGRIFCDCRLIGGAGEFRDGALRNGFQRRRREIAGVTDM